MVANSIQKTVAFDREASFCSGTNWAAISANGGNIAFTESDESNLRQTPVPNANLKQRSGATRAVIPGLLSEAMYAAKSYMYGGSSNAAPAAQATRILFDELWQNHLGGQLVGYAAELDGGSAAAPEVDAGQGANIPAWSWGFFFDVSDQRGYFRQVESQAADVLAMAPGHDLPFLPDAGDQMHAVVAYYPDWDILEDHTHADHNTLTLFIRGRQSDDGFYLRGCKVTLEFETIEAGAQTSIDVSVRCVEYEHENVVVPALAGPVQGRPDSIVGRGVATLCDLADVGDPLATQQFWGSVTPRMGIEHEPVMGPNGREGVHGYGVTEASHDAGSLEVTVPFSADYAGEWRDEVRKHCLIQIGDQPTNAWAIYFPHLAYSEEPQVADVGGRRASTLRFTVQERPTDVEDPVNGVDTSGLSAAVIHRALAKFYVLRVG